MPGGCGPRASWRVLSEWRRWRPNARRAAWPSRRAALMGCRGARTSRRGASKGRRARSLGHRGSADRRIFFRRAVCWRGYPAVGNEGFPGNLGYNKQLKTLIDEGAKVYACRFAMGALYGMREDDLIEGVIPFNPLDVLDANIKAWRDRAIIFSTWTV